MTDSMKFGPEWLRNMSADTTSSNSSNTSGHLTNQPVAAFGTANSGGGDTTSGNNVNNSSTATNLNPNSCSNTPHNNVNPSNSVASRNTFPEFRYGREEMLLLFDRNCGIPEILPSYKNLFVERVQFPLALVPSTDEEMMQGSGPPAQRPGWLQRSPVGFSTTTRGTGRVSCMERGRMRGKSIYNPVFQRPNAIFDDDQRSSAIKAERSWAERNGGAAGDPSITGASTLVGGGGGGAGGGLVTDAWNGNTPISSPRREFSNHPRNMENWRRSRNEDSLGAEPSVTTTASSSTSSSTALASSATTTFSNEGGWRMNSSSGFQNSHTRWGRSTSWRDEELMANNSENSGAVAGGGNIIMLRSNSTISTTQSDRGGVVTSKQTSTSITRSNSTTAASGSNSSGMSNSSISSRNTISGVNVWPPLNATSDTSACEELPLPEWAMENPSDVGGTFDASGAFHGAVDEDDVADDDNDELSENLTEKLHDLKKKPALKELENLKVCEVQKKLSTNKALDDDNCSSSSSSSTETTTAKSLKEIDANENENIVINKMLKNSTSPALDLLRTPDNINQKNNEDHDEYKKDNTTNSPKEKLDNFTITSLGVSGKEEENDSNAANSIAPDYAERMMKATDDMIEKLIRDDEDNKEDQEQEPMKSCLLGTANKRNTNHQQHIFVGSLQQPTPNSCNITTVENPVLVAANAATGPPNASPNGVAASISSLYNMGGLLVDHTPNLATLHQLQQQQMAAVAAVAAAAPLPTLPPLPTLAPPPHPMTSSAATDLWLYRDPQAKVQGPFSALEMTEWYRAGYFNENLFVRRVCDARFRPLGELIKICNGQMPFSHSHLIPIDLNPTTLTPPLAPVLSGIPTSSATTTDFVLKTLSDHQHQQQQHQQHSQHLHHHHHHQQQQQHEKLKVNVTAAADSLSNTLKSLISSVDISQVLNLHFQALQDRFIHQQEIEIANELAKNECFRRLSANEQDAVVRQKLQMMTLPEYLTNLTGLSNSLAALNPSAGHQLYDTIAECTKKEQLFSGSHQQQQNQTQTVAAVQQQQQQQARPNAASQVSSSAPYINNEDFLIKTTKNSTQHDLASTDLLNEFNLRLFLSNNSDTTLTSGTGASTNTLNPEFLNEQPLYGSGASTAATVNHPTAQSPMMQMWMNSLAINQTQQQQHALITPHTTQTAAGGGLNNQWLNGPLVGITTTINLSREQQQPNIMGSPKLTTNSMWDVTTLEQQQQKQQQQQHLQQQQQEIQQQQTFEHNQRFLNDYDKQAQNHKNPDVIKHNKQQESQQLQQQKSPYTENQITNANNNAKQEQQQRQQENPIQSQTQTQSHNQTHYHSQTIANEKMEIQTNNSNNKRINVNSINNNYNNSSSNSSNNSNNNSSNNSSNNNNKNNNSSNDNINSNNNTNNFGTKIINKTNKNENFVERIPKKTEDERRRELNDEKRRQKEERKRQQMEEEKRRLLQAEEEKRRQMQEEEKRQQQIQAQRRKALMSSSNNTNNNNSMCNNLNNSILISSSPNSGNNAANQKPKDQQRIQSSVAPWSTQSMATKLQGPGLAEIQKAERRERRADQQRQMEIQEKQIRALAAAAEAQDTVLKWNAAPVPVKSFAEIQAEEAKRLAHEQMELQRRKEQEAHSSLVAFSSAGSGIASSGINSSANISSIWSGNKIWGSSANTTGFWEESLKYNQKSLSAALSVNNSNMNNNNNNLSAATISSQSSSSILQQKSSSLQLQQQQITSSTIQQQQTLNKNIKKSQSVAVMQQNSTVVVSPSNASNSSGLSSNNQKKPPNNSTSATTKQAKPQKPYNNNGGAAGGVSDNKKSNAKANTNAANKSDDYESEFTNWCTKILNNMNTKVDVPTFVSFLRDLESPYEVKDYIRMYLGESKEYVDFAKQFLERRSKYKNLQRAQNAHDDDLCKPAQAITPSVNDNSENKGKQKKVKKNKMTKLDARILGFSVTAAEGRINVGDRDYGDAP